MENVDFKLMAYAIYLPIMLLLTGWVAHRLFTNSKIFMLDIFRGRESIAYSTNNLFKIGFYLLNLGAGLFIMKIYRIRDAVDMMESLSTKVGGFTVYLGVMLFFNLFLLFRGKKKSKSNRVVAPATAQ